MSGGGDLPGRLPNTARWAEPAGQSLVARVLLRVHPMDPTSLSSGNPRPQPLRLVTSDGLPPPVRRPRRRLRPWAIGALAGLAVAGVGTWLDYGLKSRLPPAPAVLLAPLDEQPVAGLVRATGSLAPVDIRVVSQPIAGQIAQVGVTVGDVVKAGQVLARFDSVALRAGLARAEARLVASEAAAFEAEVRLARIGEAVAGEPRADGDSDAEQAQEIAKARLATAAAEVAAREAAYRLAARQVGQGIVRAPVAGVVTARRVEPGQTVAAGSPLLDLASETDRLLLTAQVPEAQMARLAPGLPARFTVPAYPGRSFRAKVSAVHALGGPEGARRLPITMTVDNIANDLAVGMTASVEIATTASPGVWRAPVAALAFAPRGMTPAPDQRAVWVGDGPVLRQVPVEVGVSEGGFVELRSPALRPGASVAVGYAVPSSHSRR
jgi:HlyD family secretion protein